jgi:hypothetical protein
MATTIAIAGVVSAVASAGGAAYSASQGGKQPKVQTPDFAALGRAAVPGAKADAAARTGGGISPDFLANLVGQQTGAPEAGLGVLDDLRRSMGPGGGGGIA